MRSPSTVRISENKNKMANPDYWLSSTNPVATRDQRDLERLALRLLDHPDIVKARNTASILWRSVMTYPAQGQMQRFDNMINEYVFYYLLRSANCDPLYPKVVRLMTPPGSWFGHSIYGSRWGGDSPDFVYRMIPIAHGYRYQLRVKAATVAASSVSFSLMSGSAAPVTQAILDSYDLTSGENGEFTITIDSEPANGRSNHLQSKQGADHLLIRDVLGDWQTEAPYGLSIECISPVDRPALTEEQRAERAAKEIVDCMYFTFFCTQSGNGQPPNQPRSPASAGAFGGMPTQWGTKSNIHLREDDVLVVNTNVAGAQFRNASVLDLFFMSTDYWARTSSLNMTQLKADENGDFTIVIAHEDPGVHNWLDTGGLQKMIFGHRWQMIPTSYSGETPRISIDMVKFRDLNKFISSAVAPINSQQRTEQINARKQGYARRWVDN